MAHNSEGKPRRKAGQHASPVIADLPRACVDEEAAVEFIERQRWGDHPCCPRCGDADVRKLMSADGAKRNARFLWRCYGCKSMKQLEQFTVRIGTVYEESKLPLRVWCYAIWRSATSKKGVAALEISRQCGIGYRAALFLMHRLRHAMATDWTGPGKLSGVVETDETYVGGKPRRKNNAQGAQFKRGRGTKKTPVMGLVQRGGNLRLTVPTQVTAKNIKEMLKSNVDPKARLMTDDSNLYWMVGKDFASHEKVAHGKHEYARGDINTNTIEGAFGLLKRGLYGIWHSVSVEHLHRYLAEVEFRYNGRNLDDGERVTKLIQQADGKRLKYRKPA